MGERRTLAQAILITTAALSSLKYGWRLHRNSTSQHDTIHYHPVSSTQYHIDSLLTRSVVNAKIRGISTEAATARQAQRTILPLATEPRRSKLTQYTEAESWFGAKGTLPISGSLQL